MAMKTPTAGNLLLLVVLLCASVAAYQHHVSLVEERDRARRTSEEFKRMYTKELDNVAEWKSKYTAAREELDTMRVAEKELKNSLAQVHAKLKEESEKGMANEEDLQKRMDALAQEVEQEKSRATAAVKQVGELKAELAEAQEMAKKGQKALEEYKAMAATANRERSPGEGLTTVTSSAITEQLKGSGSAEEDKSTATSTEKSSLVSHDEPSRTETTTGSSSEISKQLTGTLEDSITKTSAVG